MNILKILEVGPDDLIDMVDGQWKLESRVAGVES